MILYLKNTFFTILQPGIVAILVPYLVYAYIPNEFSSGPAIRGIGVLFLCLGVLILFWCIWSFIHLGKGTISPADPTTSLVHKGLYKYSRNPMYLGVTAMLIGEALVWNSISLLIYSIIVWGLFHLFVIYFEEPRLKRDFGDSYLEYLAKVRRWI